MAQHIKTTQEFDQFIGANAQNPNLWKYILVIRFACYEAIGKLRKRPLLIYASKFIYALPNFFPRLGSLSLILSNRHQNYKNRNTTMSHYTPKEGVWVKANKGVYKLIAECTGGGIFDPIARYEEMLAVKFQN